MVEKIVIERTEENGWPWKGVIGGRTVYGITPTDILESLYYRYLLDIEKFCRIHVDTVEDSISVHALEDREFNRKIAELVVQRCLCRKMMAWMQIRSERTRKMSPARKE